MFVCVCVCVPVRNSCVLPLKDTRTRNEEKFRKKEWLHCKPRTRRCLHMTEEK